MDLRSELRDPWGWVAAGIVGGVGWAVGLLPVVALGVGAAVLGAKVVVGAASGRDRAEPGSDGDRPDELPAPAPGSAAAVLLARGDAAVSRLRQLSEAPGDPWLRAQVTDVDDEAEQALTALRVVGGRVTLVEQSMAGSDLRRLDAEATRLSQAAAAAVDARLRAEQERGLAAVQTQREVAVRLGTLRETLLARMEAAVLGLEGLAARMGEVVALGATAIEHDRARDLVDSLTGELDTVRAGLDEASRLAELPPS